MLHCFQLMKQNLRGELTVAQSQEQFSLKDNEFIEAVALSLHVGSSEVRKDFWSENDSCTMYCLFPSIKDGI